MDGTHQKKSNTKLATAAVTAMVAVMFMGSTLLTPLYALYRQHFGFSEITLTLLYAVYVVGNLIALLLFGRISDSVGRRRTVLPAIGVAGASALVFLCATSTSWLFWGRMLSGLAVGLAAGAGTAWLAELEGDRKRATVLAVTANFAGLALGPGVAGFLTQYGPWTLRLSFVVYLLAVLVIAVLIRRTRETVARRDLPPASSLLRPRVEVPGPIRHRFIAPAISVFGTMALIGFYAALGPTLLTQTLHQSNLAVEGSVIFGMFLVATLGIVATRRLASRTAMLGGLALLLPSLGLLVLAQAERSMAILLVGCVVTGVAVALGYRGSLQVINRIAPSDRRAEVVSAYYLAGFIGNSVPVIGVGVITTLSNLTTASTTFAIAIALFAIAALAAERRLVQA